MSQELCITPRNIASERNKERKIKLLLDYLAQIITDNATEAIAASEKAIRLVKALNKPAILADALRSMGLKFLYVG